MFDLILWPIITVYVLYSIFRYIFPSPFISLRDRSVLISGCDSGFGLLLVKALDSNDNPYAKYTAGVKVFAGCLTADGVSRLRSSCSPNVIPFLLDLASFGSISSSRDVLVPHLSSSPLHALVNNAGMADGSFVEWTSIPLYRRVMEVNFFGHVQMTRLYLDDLQRSKGRIAFLSSVSGLIGGPGISGYTASKFAIEGFADSLRREMLPWGVQVSLHEPFFFRTKIIEGTTEMQQGIYDGLSPAVQAKYGEEFVKGLRAVTDGILKISGDPMVVVTDLIHSLVSSKPYLRYHPGWVSKVMWIVSLLPAQVFDTIIRLRQWRRPVMVPIAAKEGKWGQLKDTKSEEAKKSK